MTAVKRYQIYLKVGASFIEYFLVHWPNSNEIIRMYHGIGGVHRRGLNHTVHDDSQPMVLKERAKARNAQDFLIELSKEGDLRVASSNLCQVERTIFARIRVSHSFLECVIESDARKTQWQSSGDIVMAIERRVVLTKIRSRNSSQVGEFFFNTVCQKKV